MGLFYKVIAHHSILALQLGPSGSALDNVKWSGLHLTVPLTQ